MRTLKDELSNIGVTSKEPDLQNIKEQHLEQKQELISKIDLIGSRVTSLVASHAEILDLLKKILALVEKK